MRREWQSKSSKSEVHQSRLTAQKLQEETAPKGNLAIAINQLGKTWMGDKGETYKMRLSGKLEWVCHRQEGNNTRRFTVWYEESTGLFWWGLQRSFFFDSADVADNSHEVKWYQGSDQAKLKPPRFVWRTAERAEQPPRQRNAEVQTTWPLHSAKPAPAAEPLPATREATLGFSERPICSRPPPPFQCPPRPPPGLEHLCLEGNLVSGFAADGTAFHLAKSIPNAGASGASDGEDGETGTGSITPNSDASETKVTGSMSHKHGASIQTIGQSTIRVNRFGCVKEAQGLHDPTPKWPPQNAPWLATGGICNTSYVANWPAFESSLQLGTGHCGRDQFSLGHRMGAAAGSVAGMYCRTVEMH